MNTSLRRILVRSPNWIGDQIMAFPFFYYLRKAYPNAWITAVCPPSGECVQFRSQVDEVVVLERPQCLGVLDRLRAMECSVKRLRAKGPWDLGLCLTPSFFDPWMMVRAGVKVRRGYSTESGGWFLNQSLSLDESECLHRSEEYVRLLPSGIQMDRPVQEFWGVRPEDPLDEMIAGVIPEFNAKQEWPELTLIEPPPEPYWVLAPGALSESRRWSASQFAALARIMVRETGWTGVIIGGSKESALASELVQDPELKLLDWTARGTVSEYWKVLRGAKVSVCNDSGLAHLAALCGSPLEVIWGAGRVARAQPIGPGKVNITVNPIECWPCERNTCVRKDGPELECLSGITPEMVWKGVLSVL